MPHDFSCTLGATVAWSCICQPLQPSKGCGSTWCCLTVHVCCREQLEQILEAANWAPTHNRTEPWRFTVLGRDAQDQMVDLTLTVSRGAVYA